MQHGHDHPMPVHAASQKAPAVKSLTHSQLMRDKANSFKGSSFQGECAVTVKRSRASENRRQRTRQSKFVSQKDLRFQSSPSWSFGGRYGDELDTLASNNYFYDKTGTHRCPQGEELLDHLRRRDDKHIEDLTKQGRQWKSVPGPGTYRTPGCVGDPMAKGGRDRNDIKMGQVMHNKTPSWTMSSTSRRPKTFHTLGDNPLVQHEGPLRPGTPCAKKTAGSMPMTTGSGAIDSGITPGPGHYFTRCHSAPSGFSDFHRPQGMSLEAP